MMSTTNPVENVRTIKVNCLVIIEDCTINEKRNTIVRVVSDRLDFFLQSSNGITLFDIHCYSFPGQKSYNHCYRVETEVKSYKFVHARVLFCADTLLSFRLNSPLILITEDGVHQETGEMRKGLSLYIVV